MYCGKNPKSSATGPMQVEDGAAKTVCQAYHYCPNGNLPSTNYQENIIQGAYLLRFDMTHLHATEQNVATAYNQGNLGAAAMQAGAAYNQKYLSNLDCPGSLQAGSGTQGQSASGWSPQVAQYRLIMAAQKLYEDYRTLRADEAVQAATALALARDVRNWYTPRLEDLRSMASRR